MGSEPTLGNAVIVIMIAVSSFVFGRISKPIPEPLPCPEITVDCPHCKGQGYIDDGSTFQGLKTVLQCEICRGGGKHTGEKAIRRLVEELRCGCDHAIPPAEPEHPTELEAAQYYFANKEAVDKIWAKNPDWSRRDAVITWMAIETLKANHERMKQ